MLKAYAYLRVSGKGQLDGYGLDRQRESIQRYAAMAGIEIVREYQEEGVSGTVDADDRPVMVGMIDAMEAGDVKTFVIERLDRLARKLMVQEAALADFAGLGITVISTEEPDLCSEDETRVLMRHIMGAIAQWEKCVIVRKLRKSREAKKAETGRCEGAKPYGHYENEREMLGYILQLRDDHKLSARAISERLNEGGAKPRSGKKWHPYVVTGILRAHRRVAA